MHRKLENCIFFSSTGAIPSNTCQYLAISVQNLQNLPIPNNTKQASLYQLVSLGIYNTLSIMANIISV